MRLKDESSPVITVSPTAPDAPFADGPLRVDLQLAGGTIDDLDLWEDVVIQVAYSGDLDWGA